MPGNAPRPASRLTLQKKCAASALFGHMREEAMQRRYSTTRDHEVSAGLARVIDLATQRRAANV